MKKKLCALAFCAFLIAGCSLAEDVTPPPALATVQAAPLEQTEALRPTPQLPNQEPVVISAPESLPSIFNGVSIYMDSCEPCHGPTGMGDGSMSANLSVPIPALGDLDFASAASPLDWYAVVTEGRMENFMPPFASLSDSQRWDVVAYALSMSYPIETRELGAELYAEFCATCHGASGEGSDAGPALNTAEGFAERSVGKMVELIREGVGEMPSYAGTLSEQELSLLGAFVQSLGTRSHGAVVEEPAVVEGPAPTASGGTIRGVVKNGTEGASLPDEMIVTIVALENGIPVYEQEETLAADGSFGVDELEIVPGRIYGALVEYQEVVYFSVGGHLMEETPQLDLPVTIYETSPDESSLAIDRLHIIFDFSIEGLVEISELVLLSTDGDRTVVQAGGQNAIPVRLPAGFSNLRFDTTTAGDQYSLTEDGFVIHEPVRPGEPLEIVFTYTLPYVRSLDFSQPLDLPVRAVILLAESDAPEITGDGVQDLGTRDMGGMVLRNYAMQALPAGEQLDLTLRGGHPLSRSDLNASNLAIGLGVFGFVLVGAGFFLWSWQRRAAPGQSVSPEPDQEGRNRGDLLHAIALLDDAFEAGELEQEVYEQQRAALKAQIMERMPGDD